MSEPLLNKVLPVQAAAEAPRRLLSATEVALLFGRTVRTLHAWERAGVLVPTRVCGRRYYAWPAIERLLREGDGTCRARNGSPAKCF